MTWNSDNVVFSRSMIKSNAYRSLKRASLLILNEFMSRRKMSKTTRSGRESWIIINNGEIELPYRDLMNTFKISDRTVTRSIDELIDKGFIDIAEQGNGTGGGWRTKYWIDDRWKRWGKPDFTIKKRKKAFRKLGFMKTEATDNIAGSVPARMSGDAKI